MHCILTTFELWKISTIFTKVLKTRQPKKNASAADAWARDHAEGDAIRDASLGLFVASRDGGGSKEDDEENKENDNPETPAAAASTKKKIVVSVLVLLDAIALAKATTRWSN
jgi:hypothetical protein